MQIGEAAGEVGAPEAGASHGEAGGPRALGDQVDRIVAWYRQAGRALRAGDPADWAAGLTMPQLRVLYFLGRAGPASVREVAAGVGVSQPSATETLDRLVRAGLVERTADACDRRVVRNALTVVGREMIDRPWEARRAVLASALRRASPQDRAAIARGLELLCRALAELDEFQVQSPGDGRGPQGRSGRRRATGEGKGEEKA
jgi:DNA-binding MarR family transcriptional regulator